MHKLIHRGLLAALLCGAATAALAETEVATAVEVEAESTVDALIVTARRRSESVQEVPVAISVLFGQTDPIKVAQRGILAPQLSAPEFSDTNFSYDLTATYKVTPDVLAYATIAKTFKTGGVNQNGLPTDAAGNPILSAGVIKPEDVTHLEGGLKTEFWAGRATLNLSVFRTDIDDFQATVTNGQFGVLRG